MWYASAVILLGGGIAEVVRSVVSHAFPLRWVAACFLLLGGASMLAGTIIEHRRGFRRRSASARPPSS